ncbi:MAG: MFS transporter, partial [Acidimicrobiales bacterium]
MSAVTAPTSPPTASPERTGGPPLVALALGTFAIGTDGFVIAGVLPAIARDMHLNLGTAGLLVTVFAVVYAVAAPMLTAASARFDRRCVLVVGMGVLSAANLAAAISTGEAWLIVARVAAAMGAAAYSPIALAAAVQLAPPEQRGRAVSRVLAGMTVSLVLGVPLGALVGALVGWRWTFAVVGTIAAVVAVAIRRSLPTLPAVATSSLRVRLALLGRPEVAANLGATFAWI